jgi:hypothetical protein
MTMTRAAQTEAPEFDDMELDGLDRLLIPLMMPYVWLHGMVTAPFQYRRLLKTDRKIGLRPLTSVQVSSLPQPVHEFLHNIETAIGRTGFREPVRHVNASRPQSSEATMVMTVAPSMSGEEFCMAVISHAPRRFSMTGVSFHTRMTDGHVIVTANERRVVATRQGNHDTVIFQKVTDAARLYEIHQQRKAMAVRGGRAPVTVGWHPPTMHPLEAYQRMFDETVDDGVRRGYIEQPATETVRVTVKGAILAAWSSKWPLDQILDWREARRAARVLRDIQA